MTSATRSVAVVATRLPNIDRRALSQAWFSALHLAKSPGGTVPPTAVPALPAAHPVPASRRIAGRGVKPPAGANAAAVRRSVSSAASGTAFAERRWPAGDLARRIERAIARHGALRPQQTAAIAIKAGDGRVQLLVRTDGATTRVIALCAPHVRERVDRALAHARFALAASGTALELTQ